MAEYITKEQVIDWFSPYGHFDKPIPFETLVSDLRVMKSAEVAPVRHGRWIDSGDYVTTSYGSLLVKICSECHMDVTLEDFDNYCPNCGARMDGGTN